MLSVEVTKGVVVARTCATSAWLDAVEPDTFFWIQDVPGENRAAVRVFLHRETSKPDQPRRAFRVAPCLYWRSHMQPNRYAGRVLPPDFERIGVFYAGPHAAKHGWYGANACGWSTQIAATEVVFAVPGEPRCRRPIPQVRLLGRRNLRRRDLTTLEATYLEAVVYFDRWHTFDEHEHGPAWEQALHAARSRMSVMAADGHQTPRGDVLAWAAQTERPPQAPRVFSDRIEQLTDLLDRFNRPRQRPVPARV